MNLGTQEYKNEEAFCWVYYNKKGLKVVGKPADQLKVYMNCDASAPLTISWQGDEYHFHQLGLHIPNLEMNDGDIYFKEISRNDCRTICDAQIASYESQTGKKFGYNKKRKLYSKIKGQHLGSLMLITHKTK